MADDVAFSPDFIGAKLMLTCGATLLTALRDDFDCIPWPGYWDLPGGGAEAGETPKACALRELHEEFGLRLPAARLVGRAFPAPHAGGRESWLFRGRLMPAEIARIRFGDEGQAWRLMPIADFIAHPLAVPHLRERVALWLQEG